jgi:hypothetical protein
VNAHLLIDRKLVEGRLQDFTRNSYFYIYGMTKNIALGIAAVVVITFSREPATLVPRLVFWLASISVLVVSHATAARGVLLAGYRYSWLDTTIPLGMGLLECLLFTMLQPSSTDPQLWLWWFVPLAAHMLLAVCLVLNRLNLHRAEDFVPALRPLAKTCRGWLRRDIIGASGCAGFVIVAGMTLRYWIIPADKHIFLAGRIRMYCLGSHVRDRF